MASIFDDPQFGESVPSVDLFQSWDAAAAIGSGSSYDQPRSADTVTSNAIHSMQPVTNNGTAWTGFFQDLLRGGIGYGLQKDAVQSGVIRPVVQYGTTQQQPGQYVQGTAQPMGLLPILMIGGVLLLILKK